MDVYTDLAVGATENLRAIAQYDDCNTNYYYYFLATSWTASPSSVGAVTSQSGGSIGYVTTQSPGQLSVTATYNYCTWTWDPDNGCRCPNMNNAYANATISVKPRIDSISPSRGLIGATTSPVTINGQGFTGGHVNAPWSVQNITTFTDTQIVFDLAISSSATPGNNAGAIYVTASGQDSNKKDFYVQVPTSLSIISSKTGSEGLCNNNAWCGTAIQFTYQVNDQGSQPINATMSFWDSFGATSPDPLQIDAHGGYITTCTASGLPNSGPCNHNTTSSGQFLEGALGACSPVCISNGSCVTGGPSKVNQTWHIASSGIVQQISIYCEKVLVNGQ